MAEALGWGLLAGGSLVLGALLVIWRPVSTQVVGLVMGFGAGVLLSAVSFELVEEAVSSAGAAGGAAAGFFGGALAFVTGDRLIARLAGHGADPSRPGPGDDASPALPIVLGTVLDGVPESAVLGLTLLIDGQIGVAMLVAVFLSNLPESVAATSDLLADGWTPARTVLMWAGIAVLSGLSSLAGYALLDGASPWLIAFILAFAGGAILAMLSTSMMPEAYETVGRDVGLVVTLGFALSFAVSWVGDLA